VTRARDHLKDAPDAAPWKPAVYAKEDHAAVKAVANGIASEEQQKRAARWIINTLCETYGMSYRPQSDRDTTFAEGKRHVGLQIVKLVNMPLDRPGSNTEQAR
jgi:hypothetical protein